MPTLSEAINPHSRIRLVVIAIIFLVAIIAILVLSRKNSDGPLPSRLWMEYTEDIVRVTKPPPTESARLYAYVATAYAETLRATGSSVEASTVTRNVLNVLVPTYEATTT